MKPNFSIDRGTRRAALLAVLAAAVLSACSTYNGLTGRIAQHITPYRVTIVQGNFVSAEAAAKLQVGMTRAQVRGVLGTPLLADMFHGDQWDYVFYFKRGSTSVVQQRDLIVFFDGDKLTRWTGATDLPTEQDLISEIDGDRRENTRRRELENAVKDAQTARADSASGVPGTPGSGPLPNAPQTVVTGGPQSAVPAPPQPQIRLTAPKGSGLGNGLGNGSNSGSNSASGNSSLAAPPNVISPTLLPAPSQ